MLHRKAVFCAALAGCLGALSGVLGKLAGSTTGAQPVIRAAGYVLMVLSNVGMLSLFTKALHSVSSLKATAVSTTTNILCSGAASTTLFGEHLATRWLLGAACLIAGTVLITGAAQPSAAEEPARKQD